MKRKKKDKKRVEIVDHNENTKLPMFLTIRMVPNSEVYFRYKELRIKPTRIYTSKNEIISIVRENNKIKKVSLRYGPNIFEFDSYRGEYYLANILD